MTAPALIVEQLCKTYWLKQGPRTNRLSEVVTGLFSALRAASATTEFRALRNVSFELRAGETLGIIGHNGAGKSTLLKILSGVTDPTSGRYAVRGRVGCLLEVGTGFHPELTGRENIYLNGAILGMRRHEIRRRFDEIVEFADVTRFLDTPVKRYSSGMQMRLAFAVAAHFEPEILIVDEVLAVGDAEFQKKCLGKMDEVTHSGKTVLFVSHNLAAIQRICQTSLWLHRGEQRALGPSSEVIPQYLQEAIPDATRWERTAPPTPQPHFVSLQLCQPNGKPLDVPDSASQFGLELVYRVPQHTPGLIVAVVVGNREQLPLFATSPLDCGLQPAAEPGLYGTRVMFPEALFMPREFTITVALYSIAESYDTLYAPLSFQVSAAPSLANSLPTGRMGELQILCDWTTSERLNVPPNDERPAP